jgi:phage-related protein
VAALKQLLEKGGSMEQFNISFCEEYSHSLEFKTSVVERSDLSEQRQALWMNPKRTFKLNFETKPDDKSALEAFFSSQKGDLVPFYWQWKESDFGTGLDYVCFFEDSSLAQTIYPYGYSKSALTLSMIDDGNVAKNRYFLRNVSWICEGAFTYTSGQLRYDGASTLSQKGILTPGTTYTMRVKTSSVQGLGPVLSESTAGLDPSSRQIFEGEATVTFSAQSADFTLEMGDGTSGIFSEISILKIPKEYPVFDFEYNVEHQSEIKFLNLKDQEFTYSQTRQNISSNPLRRWVLTLELSPSRARDFEEFFSWCYQGETLNVRFDTDKLDQSQYSLGYREVKIPIIEVL